MVECKDGYLVDHNMPKQEVFCTVTGWNGTECKKGKCVRGLNKVRSVYALPEASFFLYEYLITVA